jgi:hypothetical protein
MVRNDKTDTEEKVKSYDMRMPEKYLYRRCGCLKEMMV